MSDLRPGGALGRYQILGMLGRGGMANVYKAFQPALERVVALKVMRAVLTEDPEFVDRFRREAKAIARLAHPNIVQVFDFDEIDGRSVLAMQFLDGGTLKERMTALAATGARVDRAEVATIVRATADALDYAHRLGVVHRDVKPSNIMLTDGRAVVTDFGIAKILQDTQQYTQTGVGIGTPEYMSPEQGQGLAVDGRSDVYSLGVVAYELLVGRLPYSADTPMATVLKHMKDPLPLPSSIDPSLRGPVEKALLRSLAKEPADRYATAGEFASALERAIRESDTSVMPTMLPGRAPAIRAGGLSLSLPLAALALLVLAGGGAVAAVVATRAADVPVSSVPVSSASSASVAASAPAAAQTARATAAATASAATAASATAAASPATPSPPPATPAPTAPAPPPVAAPAAAEGFAARFDQRLPVGFGIPGTVPYAFTVTGADLQALTAAQKQKLLVGPSIASTWGSTAQFPFVLFVSPYAAPGSYTLVIELPDGRRAQAAFTHDAVPTPVPAALTLAFVKQLPASTNGAPAGFVPYAFQLSGFDLRWLSLAQKQALLTSPVGAAWGSSDEYELLVYMSPFSPAGSYTVTLQLPDGRTPQATFQHKPG